MTHKNKIISKEYQRLWYLKKIGKLNKEITDILDNKYGKRKRKQRLTDKEKKELRVKKSKELRRIRDLIFGDKCYICCSKVGLVAHKKDGIKHKYNIMVTILDYKKYVRLCTSCHKGVHFCMKYLKYSWEDVYKIIKSEYYKNLKWHT